MLPRTLASVLVAFAFAALLVVKVGRAAEEVRPDPPVEKLAAPPPAEVLAKIKAPAAAPEIKTKAGYTITVDLSGQILGLDKPKQDIWISPKVEAHQTVEVLTDGAALKQASRVLAQLKKGRILFTTEEKGEWVATRVIENGQVLSGWVLKKDLKPVGEEGPPQKNLAGQQGSNFASAAMLIQKAKQFDDGLYAAVELAVENGLGPIAGKRQWVPELARKVDSGKGGTPLAQMLAAAELGGAKVGIPPELREVVASERKQFLADDKRSKPIGFYTWSKDLQAIFQQDRLLQTPLRAQEHSAGILAIAQALHADREARKNYEQVLQLNSLLTNPLKNPGYREVLASLDGGKTPVFTESEMISFFPPSRAHETDLIMKLYGNRPIPEGFDLMKEVISRLKSGDLSFEPQADSGWYDHQLWSLEPLVRFDATPEKKHLAPNDEYRKHLEELFKGAYALTRETHVKQLEFPAPGEAAPFDEPVREKVYINPDIHAEPLPTMYLRRAESYRFVRGVLEGMFGKENVAKLHRQTARGPVEMNLADEIAQMENLFVGAYVVACRDIGLKEELAHGVGSGSAENDGAAFLRWVASLGSDPDLAPDCRMMVPVFFDRQRQKSKVWVMLGWTFDGASVFYKQQPKVTIVGPDGKPPAEGKGPEIIFGGAWRSLATPVFAEVYVTKILNRDEFRRHCDTYQTKAAILANLE